MGNKYRQYKCKHDTKMIVRNPQNLKASITFHTTPQNTQHKLYTNRTHNTNDKQTLHLTENNTELLEVQYL